MNKQKLRLQYLLTDALIAFVVWLLFMVFRRIVNDFFPLSDFSIFIPHHEYYSSFLVFPILCIGIHYLSGYYVKVIKQSVFQVLLSTVLTSFIISIIILFALVLDDIVIDYRYYYSSFWVLSGLLFFLTFSSRIIQIIMIRKRFKSKRWCIRTMIIGDKKNAQKIALQLSKESIYHTIIGIVCTEKQQTEISETTHPILGTLQEMDELITKYKIQEAVISTDSTASKKKIWNIINRLLTFNIDIFFTPNLYDILTKSVQLDRHSIHPLINLTEPTINDAEKCIKRAIDIFAATLSLILSLPLFVILGILIKKDSKGTVFYKQKRIGMYGKAFNIYKFRTMYVSAEKNRPQLSSPDDNRITRIGRFLRKYRLDEIPQFINIIKGDMSIVGPRPERQFYINKIAQIAPYYFLLYRIKPGLTSWGPIKIGYANTIEKMVERLDYDILYMENMNLMTDFRIILSTIRVILSGKGI